MTPPRTASRTALHALVKTMLKRTGPARLRAKMEAAAPAVASQMAAAGETPAAKTSDALILAALYRLWRRVLRNARVAEVIRDTHGARVVSTVQPGLSRETSIEAVVRATLEATLGEVF